MVQTPWQAFAKPTPERDNAAVVSYLPLKSFRLCRVFLATPCGIQSQLNSAGLLGYSLLAQGLAKAILDALRIGK